MQSSTQEIEKLIRETGDENLIKWANLMQKVRIRFRYGDIKLIIRGGELVRIERQTEMDNLSSGL